MRTLAGANLAALHANQYPGRGIVIGIDKTGEYLIQVYWLMGRSKNSRNRVLRSLKGTLFTDRADNSWGGDRSLIIYNAMNEISLPLGNDFYVVSNGSQTDTVIDTLKNKGTFQDAMGKHKYEPDTPNFTPRITAICARGVEPVAIISILRKSPWGDACNRIFYCYEELGHGFGFCMHTYSGDGNPLPAFHGEPYVVPLPGDTKDIAHVFWDSLNEENRVALAVKSIHFTSGESSIYIINGRESA
jgi:hypothetical protein